MKRNIEKKYLDPIVSYVNVSNCKIKFSNFPLMVSNGYVTDLDHMKYPYMFLVTSYIN